jgi:hypothetical protein
MRIGQYDLQQIRNKILEDLYGSMRQELDKRKEKIAKRNRKLWLKQYQHLLDQLPESMVTRHSDYYVKIKYMPDGETVLIDEKWAYRSDNPIINPVEEGNYGDNTARNPLHKDLETDTAVLCNDILKFQEEKDQMEQYLQETTQMYKGSLQLKKVWDESLHKYLPPEPVKVKRNKAEEKIAPDTPTFLKDRMTTNLLEDN